MPKSIRQVTQNVPALADRVATRQLLESILIDLAAIRTLLNTHVHGGVTVGAGNTAVPTVLAAALDLQA